tara:strand:- start:1855 stop:2205 length:351 start_codon:yes stop_codon:yes gene_type:complete
MFARWFGKKDATTTDTPEVNYFEMATAPVKYFIAKVQGHADLEIFEEEAIKHVQFLQKPCCAPDLYFAQKILMQYATHSTEHSALQNNTLKFHETAAIEFVKEGVLLHDSNANKMH